MDIRKVRDEFIGKKALAKQNNDNKNKMILQLKTVVDNLDKNHIDMLRLKGIPIDSVINVDYELLKSDNDYLVQFKQNVQDTIISIKNYIEGELR